MTYVDDMNAVAEGCDALVIATEWDEFKKLDLERARKVADASHHVRRPQSFRPRRNGALGLDLQERRKVKSRRESGVESRGGSFSV